MFCDFLKWGLRITYVFYVFGFFKESNGMECLLSVFNDECLES